MNSISMRNLVRYFFINVLVFITLWTLVEVVNYFLNPFNRESARITCSYDWVLYNYCPNITDVKVNTEDDGGDVVFTFSNDIGQRVSGFNSISNSNAEHVFVGDSFIQAEEIDYALTFYGQLEKEHNVTAIGYSSWNIIEYREAIKKLSIINSHYHVFLMPNDITPKYYRSVYKENRSNKDRKEDIEVPVGLLVEFQKAYSNSLTSSFFDIAFSKVNSSTNNNLESISLDDFSIERVGDCAPLEQLPKQYKEVLGYDYLVYSKSPKCWGSNYQVAAEEAVLELKKLRDLVSELNSNLTVYMVPPGWSFPNQNTNGRKNNGHYFFSDNMTITTEPLLTFFESAIPSIDFVNLEGVITKWVEECAECKNQYYFADDGHWTPETHHRLSLYFKESLALE